VSGERSSQALELVEELHRRQREMYAGGPLDPVIELLAPHILWHVPGSSPIAGSHRGTAAVVDYFERRRRLASSTMRMFPGKAICEGEAVAQLVRGTAVLGADEVSWQTVGVYRVELERRWIRETWLVPLDGDLFDRIWGAGEA
jgi:uncharacterized protein